MRWPFRREPSGRHALGAAVTAIPAGPLSAPVQLPPSPAPAPSPVADDLAGVSAPPPATQLSFLASGPTSTPDILPVELVGLVPPGAEVVVDTTPTVQEDPPSVPDVRQAGPIAVVPVQAASPAADRLPTERALPAATVPPAAVVPVQPAGPRQLDASPVVPVVAAAPAPTPLVPVQPHDSLEALLAVAEAVQPPAVPGVVPLAQAPAEPVSATDGPRVELGFADGTYRMLDPASDTARALSDLVAELTAPAPGRSDGGVHGATRSGSSGSS